MITRRSFMAALPLAVPACTAAEVWAPDEIVDPAIYRGSGPRHLRLFTMRSTRSDSGVHTSLLIDASQRVIFDPAGTLEQSYMPERNDVLFGVSPRYEDYFVRVHARVSYYVVTHKIFVAPEVAEKALTLALEAGPVPQANCARATSRILRALPGFETIPLVWWPTTLDRAFGALPGVETQEFREADSDDKSQAAGPSEA